MVEGDKCPLASGARVGGSLSDGGVQWRSVGSRVAVLSEE